MDHRKDKLILVDCDGVLLDWGYAFYKWMEESNGLEVMEEGVYNVAATFHITKTEARNLVRQFNESARIGFLPGFKDAIKYVKMLHAEGYIFHCITSLSTDEYAKKARMENLERLFGKGVFEELICLDCGADKDEGLLPYKDSGCIWVEDKPHNAECGIDMGLRSILIEHGHNVDYENNNLTKVKNWKEIYEMIV
jgi:FMN phosphatase YigB (HAD superfamily)|tara:strand:+ start:70 stop:654 length:585 start_codon:yes stop_codon:yes gene_type:complete